ncbi:HAD-IC family P-type ATPase, partial [Candidatus Uhrbacteria bacterium]|nr:HAD-IC family P-type ATPase [Candidatus Uhrbacteria bacterium]MBD3284197.1 HAD-IC family P-type ATPase [Candidatus Uhrbacteria bacterium]
MLTQQIHPRELAGISSDQALQQLNSTEAGLDTEERQNRSVRFGSNTLPKRKGPNILLRFLKEFTSPFVFLLLGVVGLSLYMHEWGDAIIISIVLLVNAIIGTIQSERASRALKALERDVTFQTQCLVNGTAQVCNVDDLVPGDITFLQAGDRIPADGRWIEVRDLRVDESSLTGESVAVSKTATALELKSNAIAADVRNAGYTGTTVISGSGTLLVTSIGAETEVGRIAAHLSEKRPEPPLVTRVRTLSHQVLTAVSVIALILFLAGLISGRPILESIPLILALIVAIVPEGLPVVLTIVLAKGVRDMSQRNAIVRELQAVESLGGVDVIYTDKTGTLTYNELRFNRAVLADETRVEIRKGGEVGVSTHGKEQSARRFAALMAAVADPAAAMEERLRSVDPIDRALLDLIRIYDQAVPTQHDVRPFDGNTRTRAVVTEIDSKMVSVLAGSPEQIFEATGDAHPKLEQDLLQMAKQGLRVIAFAEQEGEVTDYASKGWKLTGLVGLRDNPRTEAGEAIRWCLDHKIGVTMVTGDHPETAYVIAKELGLAEKRSEVILGEDLMRLHDDELRQKLTSIRVIARATP